MTGFKPKPIDEPDLINILMLTRGRTEKVVRAIASLDDRAFNKDQISLWIYADDDDRETQELIKSGWERSIGIPIYWHISSRPITHGRAFNELWQISSNAGLYMGFGDDYEVTTHDWDVAVREAFRNIPADRIAVGYAPDPVMPEGGITVMVETAQWVNSVGHFIVPYFPYWYGDKWLQQIAEMINRKYSIPVGIYPLDGELGTTHRLWDLPFWTRFFHLLLAERIDTAKKLITHMNSDNSLARSKAIEFMHDRIEEYEIEAENELPAQKLFAHQLALTAEFANKDETYLKAFSQAEHHLKEMTPRIIDMKIQHVMRLKQKLLLQSMEK